MRIKAKSIIKSQWPSDPASSFPPYCAMVLIIKIKRGGAADSHVRRSTGNKLRTWLSASPRAPGPEREKTSHMVPAFLTAEA
jgi:hypothetical protein